MKKRVRKVVSLLTAMVMSLSLPVYAKAADESMEYVTWLNAGEDDPVIDGFMKENPNIKVEMNIVDGTKYEELMQPRLMAGDAPDVMIMQKGMFLKYKKENWLADISDLPFAEKIKDNQNMLDVLGDKDGKIYAVPVEGGASSIMIYYNKKIFDKYGISIPKTEEEFFAACETLKQNNVDPMVFGGADIWTVYGMFGGVISNEYSYAEYGEKFADRIAEGDLAYSEANRKGLETFEKLVKNEYIAKSTASLTYEQSVQYFADGKAAMIAQGSWLASLEQITGADPEIFDLGVFLYPAVNKNEAGLRVVSTDVAKYLVVMKDAKHPEEAKKLVEYFSNDAVLKEYLERQNLRPVLPGIEVAADPLFADYYGELEDNSKVELTFRNDKYKLPAAADEAICAAYQNLMSGSTVEEEVKKIDEAFESNKDKIELVEN